MTQHVAQALIAPRKYVQGRGLLSSLGKFVEELGKDALVIADESVWELVRDKLEQPFAAAGVRLIEETFGGECSKRELERLGAIAEHEGQPSSSESAAVRRWTPPRRSDMG